MNTQRIYFQKLDELEAMLGQKPADRPSNARNTIARIANRAWQWMHEAAPPPTPAYEPIRVTPQTR